MTKKNNLIEQQRILASQLWDDETCPYFDLVMLGDGRIFPLQIEGASQLAPEFLKSDGWINVSDVPGLNEPSKMNEGFSALNRRDFPERDISISVGECFPSGENGFVACTTHASREFLWLAFFVKSNPFENIDIENNEVVATTTLNRKYFFPLENPVKIRIT